MIVAAACVGTGESPLESRFARERAALVCYDGPMSEPSCGGGGMLVYLSGDKVRHLDWSVETSTRFIRRQFYFADSFPALVVETIHAKFNQRGEPLPDPRFVSAE